jgi:predicted MPP superfamily phosphohydrolase
VLARPAPIVRHNRTELVDLRQSAGQGSPGRQDHHFLARLPGNEMLQLNVVERALNVPRLPAALDGITILHLSDFHFSGRIGKAYFEEVVRVSNRLEPDLVAITGDFVDRPACIDWVPDTLGKLAGRAGTWFVLGNHDLRVDTDRLRRTLLDSGLIGVGGRWTEIRLRGEPVILAGNELPWISPAADLATAPPRLPDGPLRIALAHSPDQLAWARANDVDLLLTGHTHGGQIRIPLIGPLLSATRLGVRYCCGPYHVPPTILHVTSGVSSVIPVRLLCPPEIVKLVLHSAL